MRGDPTDIWGGRAFFIRFGDIAAWEAMALEDQLGVRAAKRWIVFVVVGFVPYVGNLLAVVIVLPIIWDNARQGLHDKFADTLVLRNDSVPWA